MVHGSVLLKRFLREQRLSERAFAARAGVNISLVHYAKHGKKRPGLDGAMKIERATDGAIPASAWESAPRKANGKEPRHG